MKPEPSEVICAPPWLRPSLKRSSGEPRRKARQFVDAFDALAGGDVHHRRRQPLGEIGKALGRIARLRERRREGERDKGKGGKGGAHKSERSCAACQRNPARALNSLPGRMPVQLGCIARKEGRCGRSAWGRHRAFERGSEDRRRGQAGCQTAEPARRRGEAGGDGAKQGERRRSCCESRVAGSRRRGRRRRVRKNDAVRAADWRGRRRRGRGAHVRRRQVQGERSGKELPPFSPAARHGRRAVY